MGGSLYPERAESSFRQRMPRVPESPVKTSNNFLGTMAGWPSFRESS